MDNFGLIFNEERTKILENAARILNKPADQIVNELVDLIAENLKDNPFNARHKQAF